MGVQLVRDFHVNYQAGVSDFFDTHTVVVYAVSNSRVDVAEKSWISECANDTSVQIISCRFCTSYYGLKRRATKGGLQGLPVLKHQVYLAIYFGVSKLVSVFNSRQRWVLLLKTRLKRDENGIKICIPAFVERF